MKNYTMLLICNFAAVPVSTITVSRPAFKSIVRKIVRIASVLASCCCCCCCGTGLQFLLIWVCTQLLVKLVPTQPCENKHL